MLTFLRWHRPLVLTTLAMAVLSVVSGFGLLLDDRLLLGAPIWLKPFKFALSIGVYSLTLAWLLSLQSRPRPWPSRLGTLIALAGAVEMLVIVFQTVRGRPSHFNVSTPFDSLLWNTMAGTIVTLWVANLALAAIAFRQPLGGRALTLAFRAGLVVSLLGMALAFTMTTGPTVNQQRLLDAGGKPDLIGGHAVGVEDGGPGLPLTGWSTTGGDLRIGHFLGLHALQVLPLLALALPWLARRLPRLAEHRAQSRTLIVAATGYAGLMAVLTWQALRGQSVIHPDGLTLTVLGSLALAFLAGLAWSLRRPAFSGGRAVMV